LSPEENENEGGGLFTSLFTTDAVARATSDGAWLQAMLDVEAALARAETACGLTTREAASEIGRAAQARLFDPVGLGRAARLGGNPVIPLLSALRERLGSEASAALHRGATSQDILDSAMMLLAKRATELVLHDLDRAAAAAADLAEQHRDTVEVARTLLQPAVPTTFGLRAAGWANALLDSLERLESLREHLPLQLGGAAGTLASLGEHAGEVRSALAAELQLELRPIPWHSDRQPVAELGAALALTCGTCGKVGRDVSLLSMREVAEVHEPAAEGRGVSSTLPQKRNPVLSTLLIANARRAPLLAATLTTTLDIELERSPGTWQAEWPTVTTLLQLSGGSAARAAELLEGLEVDGAIMTARAEATADEILSEAASLTGHLPGGMPASLGEYLGLSKEFVDAVVARLRARQARNHDARS
jgi:3-carboxy-cis,cis-muconate cycloisomerase